MTTLQTMTPRQIRERYENDYRLLHCPGHCFDVDPGMSIADPRLDDGIRCRVCGGHMPWIDFLNYLLRVQREGGDVNAVAPGLLEDDQ